MPVKAVRAAAQLRRGIAARRGRVTGDDNTREYATVVSSARYRKRNTASVIYRVQRWRRPVG
jgi:hypothetical protein